MEKSDMIIADAMPDEVTGRRIIPASGGGWNFSALRNINYLLEHSKNCPNESIRIKYNALARFFRAYFYFEKIKRFGDVPWYDKVLGSNDPDLYKPRDSRKFVMQKIIEDIDFAIANLSEEKHVYQITKWTALALKSRICLFEGTFRKYHGIGEYEAFLNNCIAASDILMTQSGYGIYSEGETPYMDLFASMNAISKEVILARDYDDALAVFHNVQDYENSGTKGKVGLSKRMVNSYLMKDGNRFTDIPNNETMQFFDECQNRDPRLAQTIRTPGYMRKGSTAKVAPNLGYTCTGYHLIKYTGDPIYDIYNSACNDLPIFRMAEVYLNFAEAKAENGTLTQEDINRSIKLLRDRVKMPNLDMAAANANPDPFLMSNKGGYSNVSELNKGVILEIRRERTIELIMEDFRYWDIMRWKEGKVFEQPMEGIYIPGPGIYDLDGNGRADVCFWKGTKPSAFVSNFFEIGSTVELSNGDSGNILCQKNNPRTWSEDKDYFFPIPIIERTLNRSLTQNSGWNDGLSF